MAVATTGAISAALVNTAVRQALYRIATQTAFAAAKRAPSAIASLYDYMPAFKRPRYNGNGGRRPAKRARGNLRTPRMNYRSGGYLGIESKFIDYEYDAAIASAVAGSEADPATVNTLNAIAQGDGESNRDGRKILVTGVTVRGSIRSDELDDSGTIGAGKKCRLVLLMDQQTNGAQFNAEDVLEDPTDTDLDVHAFRNLQFTSRFKVLHDKIYEINPTAAGGTGAVNDTGSREKIFSIHRNLQMPVLFTGTTANVSTINTNSLHLIAICNGGCTLRYLSRVRFHE